MLSAGRAISLKQGSSAKAGGRQWQRRLAQAAGRRTGHVALTVARRNHSWNHSKEQGGAHAR
jgi:hypothetical protein